MSKKKIILGSSIAGLLLLGTASTAYAMEWNHGMTELDAAYADVDTARDRLERSVAVYDRDIKNASADAFTENGNAIRAGMSASRLESVSYHKVTPDSKKPKTWNVWELHDEIDELHSIANEMNSKASSINRRILSLKSDASKKSAIDAKKKLAESITKANALYNDTDGKVTDDSTRKALKKRINESTSVLDNKKTFSTALYEKRGSVVDDAMKSVSKSHEAYESEQARIAREQEAIRAAYRQSDTGTVYYAQQPDYNDAGYYTSQQAAQQPYVPQQQAQAPAPAQSPQPASSGYNSAVNASCDATNSPANTNSCQGAVDQGGMVDISYYGGSSHIYSQHNETGGAWINNLKPGDSVSFGGKQFTVNDYSKQGATEAPFNGYYAQTCNENGNHIIGLTPKN